MLQESGLRGLPGLTPFAPCCFACFVSKQPAVRPTCPCLPFWLLLGTQEAAMHFVQTHRGTRWHTVAHSGTHCVKWHTVAHTLYRDTQWLVHNSYSVTYTVTPFWDTRGLHFVEKQLDFAKRTQDRWILKRPKCAHRQLSFVDPQLHICSLMPLVHVPQLGYRLASYT